MAESATAEVRRGLPWNAANTFGGQVAGLLLSVTLTRWLGVESFGRFVAIWAAQTLIVTISTLSLERAGLVAVAREWSAGSATSVVPILALSSILAAAAGFVAAFGIGTVAPDMGERLPMWFGLLISAEVLRMVASELPRSWGDHRTAALCSLGMRSLMAVSVIAVHRLDGSRTTITVVVASMALTSAALAAAALLVTLSTARARATGERKALIPISRMGLHLTLANFGRHLLNQGDILIVVTFLGPKAAAVYGIATRLVNQVGGILTMINSVVLPGIVRSGAREAHSDERHLRLAASLAAVPAGLVAAVLFVATGPAISIAFGDAYAGAVPLVRLLLIGQVVNVLTGLGGSVLLREGRTQLIVAANLAVGTAAVIAETCAAAAGSLQGVALTSGLAFALTNVVLFTACIRIAHRFPAPYGVGRLLVLGRRELGWRH